MSQDERLDFLITYLLHEDPRDAGCQIPDHCDKKKVLRALMNVRLPKKISQEFLTVQDAYLQEALSHEKITAVSDLLCIEPHLYVWKGDITKLKTEAIVNAANDALLGCFIPNHGCIDNAIHSYAGIQLRLACQQIMERQGTREAVGKAKITKGYNLPARYVLHTVGPTIYGKLTEKDCDLLASCYRSCLALADSYHLKSIAFCCISTGEFHFPHDIAAQIAVDTVKNYILETHTEIEVIFNVFKEQDDEIYKRLLG